MGDTNERFVDFRFRKPTVHSITRVYCISMNIIVILRVADLYLSMKIRPIIERLTHQSNRKRDELAFLHRALRIYIISNKLPRVQGETLFFEDYFDLEKSVSLNFISIFYSIQIRNDHIIYLQSWVCHRWSSRTETSWSEVKKKPIMLTKFQSETFL